MRRTGLSSSTASSAKNGGPGSSKVAQFDVFENPNRQQRGGFPYLVVMQNDQLSGYSTRLVMPLVRLPAAPAALPGRLSQTVTVAGEALYPAAHLSGAIPVQLLRRRLVCLNDQADTLRDALDAVLSGV